VEVLIVVEEDVVVVDTTGHEGMPPGLYM